MPLILSHLIQIVSSSKSQRELYIYLLRDCQGQAAENANSKAHIISSGLTASLFFNSATSAVIIVVDGTVFGEASFLGFQPSGTTVSVSLSSSSGLISKVPIVAGLLYTMISLFTVTGV